jgi:hypothetical protein
MFHKYVSWQTHMSLKYIKIIRMISINKTETCRTKWQLTIKTELWTTVCYSIVSFSSRFFLVTIRTTDRYIFLTFPAVHCLGSGRIRRALVSPGRWSVYTRSKYICNVWIVHDGHSAFRTSAPSPLRFRLRTAHLLDTSKTDPSFTLVICTVPYLHVYETRAKSCE